MMCSSCKKPPDISRSTFVCDNCNDCYCKDCSCLTASEIKVLELRSRTMTFYCKSCKSKTCGNACKKNLETFENIFLKKFEELQDVVEKQNKKIEEQSQLIVNLVEELKGIPRMDTGKSYANVTKNEVIVVKPKEKQESKLTKSDIKENVNPRELAIAVENIREVKGGAVIINCNNVTTKEKIKDKVEKDLGDKYSITEGYKKNPKIIIRGVEAEFIEGDDEVILGCLRHQNDLDLNDLSVFQVHTKYLQKDKFNKGNIILTVDALLKETICNMEKVNIGWRRCVVHEFFTIIRCYKCGRYGHISSKCTNQLTCFRCAGMHTTNECSSSTLKCINCSERNLRFKTSLKVDHVVSDPDCACYKRYIELEALKTKRT